MLELVLLRELAAVGLATIVLSRQRLGVLLSV